MQSFRVQITYTVIKRIKITNLSNRHFPLCPFDVIITCQVERSSYTRVSIGQLNNDQKSKTNGGTLIMQDINSRVIWRRP